MKTSSLRLAALLALLSAVVGPTVLSAGPLGGGGGTRPERTRPAEESERARAGSSSSKPARTRPSGENMSEKQRANLQTLQADLASIKAGSTVTPEQKTAVKNSLAAVADGATKPSDTSVTALADSLTTALADGTVNKQEKAQITKNVQTVLQSANIPQSEVDALIQSTTTLLTASGVTQAEATTVANDLRAIATELKANASAATATH